MSRHALHPLKKQTPVSKLVADWPRDRRAHRRTDIGDVPDTFVRVREGQCSGDWAHVFIDDDNRLTYAVRNIHPEKGYLL